MAFLINPGDIIIVDNYNGNFLSKAIRFFTNSWTHTAVGFVNIPRNPLAEQMLFEANIMVGLTAWDKTFDDYGMDVRVYRWKKKVASEKAVWEIFDAYNGNTYGFAQLLWFVWRWVIEKLHLPKRWAVYNFFPGNEICTEVVYVFFKKLNDTVVNGALQRLGRNQNSVHPGDIIAICEDLCKVDALEMVYNRQR
jgi:hypothetical protein